MQAKDLKLKILKSNMLLERAKDYMRLADRMPADDSERVRLEKEAEQLFEDAKQLTDDAKSKVNKLSSSAL
jgi:hypothetical protein